VLSVISGSLALLPAATSLISQNDTNERQPPCEAVRNDSYHSRIAAYRWDCFWLRCRRQKRYSVLASGGTVMPSCARASRRPASATSAALKLDCRGLRYSSGDSATVRRHAVHTCATLPMYSTYAKRITVRHTL
jgi:hypothetical protein